MKTITKFYLNNYKGIHHTFGILVTLTIAYVLKMGGFDFGLFDTTGNGLPAQILFLVANYFITEWSLEKSGLNSEVKKLLTK